MVQEGRARDGGSSRSSRGPSPRGPPSAGARSGGRPPTPAAATSRLGAAPHVSATSVSSNHVPLQGFRPQTAPLQASLPRLPLASVGRPPTAAWSPAGSSDPDCVTTPHTPKSMDCVTSPLRPALPPPTGGNTRGSPIVERNQRRNNLRRRRSIECGALHEAAPVQAPPSAGGVWMGLKMPPPPVVAAHCGEIVAKESLGEGLSSRLPNASAAPLGAVPPPPPSRPISSCSDSDDGLSASSSASDGETTSVASQNSCRFAFPFHLTAFLQFESFQDVGSLIGQGTTLVVCARV